MSIRAKVARVDRTLRMFGLQAAADVQCGAPGGERGLSGGQRKRLSVALEVIADPALMLLDEPTSGLDAASARNLVNQLSALAKAGRTVICTIHQPTTRVFQMFDEVMLLARGDIVYHGPVGDVVSFFEKQGLQCPAYYNPADFLIDVTDEQQGPVLSKVVGAYKTAYATIEPRHDLPVIAYPAERYPVKSSEMIKILLKRSMRLLVRDKIVTRLRLVSHIVAGVVTGFLWFKQTIYPDSFATVQNRISLLFFSIIFLLLNSVIPTVLTFPQQRAVFEKEHRNNWYSALNYFISQTIADVPFQIVLPILYGILVYGMAGLRGNPFCVFQFFLICVLQTLVGQSLGVFVSCLAPSLTFAVFAAPISTIPQLLLCGFLANLDEVPIPLKYLQYLSFVRYTFEGLLISQFKGYTIGDPSNPANYFNGDIVFDQLAFDSNAFGRDVGVVIGFIVFFRIAAYMALRKRVKRLSD